MAWYQTSECLGFRAGVSFAGYDVGGFAGEPSKFSFLHEDGISCFFPQLFVPLNDIRNDSKPLAFGEEVEKSQETLHESFAIELLQRILYSAFINLLKTGLPQLPSKFGYLLSNQEFARFYQSSVPNQYLFCDSLFNRSSRKLIRNTKVYLPEGEMVLPLFQDKVFIDGREVTYN